MGADRVQNLQDTFLNHVRKNKTPLTIFLINGVKLLPLPKQDFETALRYELARAQNVPAPASN